MIATALLSAALSTPAATDTSAYVLPTVFEAGHIYAIPETTDGQHLKLLVDTGGGGGLGMYWVTAEAAKRMRLSTRTCPVGKLSLPVIDPPHYVTDRAIPQPLASSCGRVVLVNPTYEIDGQLGAGYFPGRVWTFDYPAQRLVREDTGWRPATDAHATALGFLRDAHGKLESGFPRITIHVDGEPLDMLLDTGATSFPAPAAARISGTPTAHGEGVASYITVSTLEHWHKAHPDWRVVENADDKVAAKPLRRIIEVPRVEIAGWSTGPVWFTEQPDSAFHSYMASMMDKPTEGAVGGNVFSHFAMTIDYPNAKAWFRCVTGCRPATPPPAP